MIEQYEINKQYLKDEFKNCRWDPDTGMNANDLEKQINAMWDAHGNESTGVARARIQRYIIENAQLELNPKSLFPGKLNSGITYTGCISLQGMFERLFQRIRRETLEKVMPDTYARIREAASRGIGSCETDFWHTQPDWRDILSLGLTGLKERAVRARDEKLRTNELTPKQADFYKSVLITLDAIDIYLARLIEYAEEKGGFGHFVECLRALRLHAPKTTYQAMMLSVIYIYIEEMGCERARTLGRIDQLYYPFFKSDLESGECTLEEMREMYRYFFGRFSQAYRFAAQPFCLGGTLADGSDAWNELSDFILDVYDEMDIYDPKIHIRWHKDFPTDRLRRILSMIRKGHSAMVLVNDETVYASYERIGILRDEVVEYTPLGCYEPMIMGAEDAMIGASWLNIAKAVELSLNNGADMNTGYPFGPKTGLRHETFEEFYRCFFTQLDTLVETTIDGIEKQNGIAMSINPSPLYSLSMKSCIERGKDVFEGGMKYSNVSVKCCGIATAADALAAIETFVYDEKIISLEELSKAMRLNWVGYEELRLRALALPEKFGNHRPRTDRFAKEIYEHLFRLYVGRPAGRGGVYKMGGDSITRCVDYGRGVAATPDGRKNGQPVSKNFSATAGMEKEGLTASILSALAIDHTQFSDACVLDFMLHPSAVEGEEGLSAMVNLTEVYLKNGGFAFQGNVLSPDELRDAQKNPQKYPNLQVRVCGWNEYFVNLSKTIQDSFIRRLEA